MTQLTRSEIERQIAGISEALKGPRVSNIERMVMNEERKDLRKLLAELPEGKE